MDLKNKIVLITGASSGLGKELSIRFGRQGSDLIITSNQKIELDSVVRRIAEEGKAASVWSEYADLENKDDVYNIVQNVLKRKYYLDILVNCAGAIIPNKLEDSRIEDWERVLAVNLTAPYLLIKGFIKSMNDKSQSPLIVNISSKSGKQGSPFCISYVASKHGLNGLTEAVNEEFRIHGKTRAISICPGSMDTPIQKTLNGYPGIAPKPGVDAVLSSEISADLIVDIVRYSDTINVGELNFEAKKDQIFKGTINI